MHFYQINKNLYLIQQDIPKTKEDAKPEATNHIWIYDRSGSMYSELSKLIDDLTLKVREIPVGDTLTLGWFSGEGEYNYILKGFQISKDADYKVLEKVLQNNRTTISCTCFSEILAETETVIKDLKVFSEKFSLMFLTDGYPVVSNYTKEKNDIFKAISKIEKYISSSCLVGYGNYYNRDLMMEMAENLGGSLIHSKDLPQFSIILSDLIKNAGGSDGKIQVNIQQKPDLDLVFSISDNSVNIYKEKDGSVNFIPNLNAKEDFVYYLKTSKPVGATEIKFKDNELLRPTKQSTFLSAIYAAGCLLSQKTKTDLAMEVLASIGEVRYVKLLNNAFTNADYGAVEAELKQAVFTPKMRFQEGIDKKFLPPEDVFCLLDMVEMLTADENAYFYPYHEKFKYNRIGAPAKVIGDYPEFKAEDNVKCPFNKLTWHQTLLNLSVAVKINGTVKLKGSPKKLGLPETLQTYINRNYTIVKDGFVNTPVLPVSLSESTFNTFVAKGILTEKTFVEDKVYFLDLTSLPIMNRKIAKGKTSAKDLSDKVFQEIELQAQLKVLNDKRKDLFSNTSSLKEEAFASYTAEQIALLDENGVTKNGFSPKTVTEPIGDFYFVKEFDIKVKGFSSLPKVSDVMERLASNKKLRNVDAVMKKGIDLLTECPDKVSDKVKLAWIDDKIGTLKKDLHKTRFSIQKTKFAIILGKKWFDEFDSRENSTLETNGNTFIFDLKESRIDI